MGGNGFRYIFRGLAGGYLIYLAVRLFQVAINSEGKEKLLFIPGVIFVGVGAVLIIWLIKAVISSQQEKIKEFNERRRELEMERAQLTERASEDDGASNGPASAVKDSAPQQSRRMSDITRYTSVPEDEQESPED